MVFLAIKKIGIEMTYRKISNMWNSVYCNLKSIGIVTCTLTVLPLCFPGIHSGESKTILHANESRDSFKPLIISGSTTLPIVSIQKCTIILPEMESGICNDGLSTCS